MVRSFRKTIQPQHRAPEPKGLGRVLPSLRSETPVGVDLKGRQPSAEYFKFGRPRLEIREQTGIPIAKYFGLGIKT